MHRQVRGGHMPLRQDAWQLAGLIRVLRQQILRVVVVLITADIGRRGRLGYVCSCAIAHVHFMLCFHVMHVALSTRLISQSRFGSK